MTQGVQSKPSNVPLWASRIRQWANADFDDLRVQAEHVAELLQHPGWEVVRALAGERIQGEINTITSRGLLSRAEYAAHAAEARGMKQVLDLPPVVLEVFRDELNKRSKDAELASQEETHGRTERQRSGRGGWLRSDRN